ncbi:MAG: LTA synthase family protein [Lachnospiraceae bacterium]|nr:LTA synthase family protein [Lachnospiraceae bacterium]
MKTFLPEKYKKLKTLNEKHFKTYNTYMNKMPIAKIFLVANMLNLIIEMLSRHSVYEGLQYFIFNIMKFEYNVMIIFATLTIAFLFSKRNFIVSLVSLIWLALGVINCILLSFRTTPLGVIDFTIFLSALSIVKIYLTSWQIALALTAAIAAVLVTVFLWFRCRRYKVRYVKACSIVFSSFALLAIITFLSVKVQALPNNYDDIAKAYEDYGFTYCFSNSVMDIGISRPEDYSKQKMDKIVSELKSGEKTESEEKPNIIFVQLESFLDVNYLKNMVFSENPVPCFDELKQNGSSGFLSVSSVGAGTANTEFEVITGMDLDYFGPGEYPYNTILKSTTCETINYNLKELGYICHAIHNNGGSFYSRNNIFSNLGFDTFSSVEYMQNIERNPIGWPKDKILTDEIIKALDSTGNQDFIYTISVQGHGKYPTTAVDENQDIKLLSGTKDESYKISFEYYINQLRETDDFIKELTDTLSGYGEPTVVVFFGDHLPEIGITEEKLENKNLYQTEYVMWSNFELPKERVDMEAYELSAYVLGRLGFDNGLITKLHQNCSSDSDYFNKLELLEYDMLYGDKEVYGNINPYSPTKLKMGIYDISISSVKKEEDETNIFGENFTEYTTVLINGKRMETEFINHNLVRIADSEIKNGDVVMLAQVGDDKAILSMSKEYIYDND